MERGQACRGGNGARHSDIESHGESGSIAVMTTDPREVAWFAVHEALPAYWKVGPGRLRSSSMDAGELAAALRRYPGDL